jgi:hypothetical protein
MGSALRRRRFEGYFVFRDALRRSAGHSYAESLEGLVCSAGFECCISDSY